RPAGVLLVPVAVGVAGSIEPVPTPSLAVMRRREQSIDHLLVSVRAPVREERINLGRRRRQSGEIEVDAADERGPVGFRRWSGTSFSSRARMKLSIGLRMSALGFASWLTGTSGRLMGWNAQWLDFTAPAIVPPAAVP